MAEASGDAAGAPPAGPRVDLYDTTLRDGTQREGLSLSARDKVRIAERLARFGVRYVEGGWPGSNPKDRELFARAGEMDLGAAELTAFGSTTRPGVAPGDDLQVRALLESGAPVITIFGKSWVRHVEGVLRTTRAENLRMIRDTVAFLRAEGRRVIYDAEHFFDGHGGDAGYALATLGAAAEGGAACLVLCDTNGGSLPERVEAVLREARGQLPEAAFGIHAHDDGGLAVANSLAAVRAGATQVQGTVNGYGERCGNANLLTVAANLELKLGRRCVAEGQLAELTALSRFVADVANLPPDAHAPYVGRSAFAHKGGVHVSAVRRDAGSYEHVAPEVVGNARRVVVSELSGRSNVLSKAEELGLGAAADGAARSVVASVKEREARGYAYEAAEASVALLIAREQPGYAAPFAIVEYQASVGRRRGVAFAEATLRVEAGGEERLEVADGNGPVAALDGALRKALVPLLPALADVYLVDYKVRILDGQDGTASTTRVIIDHALGDARFSTVGASPNIVEASLEALTDGYEYGLRLAAARVPAAPKTRNA
ncbi:MAG: citramalate synthase [Myxococcota bacterium]